VSTLPLVKAFYLARATATPISFGKASSGNLQISVEFKIEENPEFDGEIITYLGTFSDGSTDFTLEALLNAGWQGDDPWELKGVPANQALPEQVSLNCAPDTWEGKIQLKINWVNKPRGHFKFKEEAGEDELRALGARVRSTVQGLRAQGGRPRQQASGGSSGRQQTTGGGGGGGAQHPNAPGNRDDIPFVSADIGHEPGPIAAVLRRMP
jgi:hypothetical protein